jgi:hypothetical protein
MSNNNIMNTSLINGPINVIRMEGQINNIHKIIYIYMDYHLPTNRQLQCDDTAIDIQYHFAENLKNVDKNIDFFLEIWPSHISTKQNIYRGRYIDEVARYFKKHIHHKKNIKETSLKRNKTLKRNETINNKNIIRYHFIDIRDVLETNIYRLLSDLLDIFGSYSCNKTYPDTKLLIDLITKLHNNYNLLYDITFNHKKYDESTILPEYKDTYIIIEYYINKIKSKYENKNIASIINNKLNTFIKPYFDNIFNLLKNVNNIIKQIEKIDTSFLNLKLQDVNGIKKYSYGYLSSNLNKLIFELNDLINIIDNESLHLFSRYVDVFFLRRFLDKNYITNAITYTGSAHSIIYITTLLQDFDFKITNYSYSKINNIDELNKKIKNAKENYEIEELLYPSILTQCSNLKNFPSKFN